VSHPLVSVIVPTHNRPELLDTAIRSALAQRYSPIEICIVDDGSTPPAALAPDLASDARIRLIRIDESLGPATARNLAIERSVGPLLAFLDDDDQWLPDKTARQVEALAARPDAAGVQCGWEFADDRQLLFTFIPDVQRDLPRLLLEGPVMAPSSVMIRRAAFDEVGGFDPELRRMEDWDLWLRLADHHEFALMPDVLVRRRGHPGRIVAGEELPAYEGMIARLRPRLATLPEDERRRLELHHTLGLARLQARAGRRRQALRTVLHVSRSSRSPDVYKELVVVMSVETPPWRILRDARLRRSRKTAASPKVRSW
jgi:glycosyltransferase involved in cell wall biosynthesis